MEYYSAIKKEMSYQAMKRHAGILEHSANYMQQPIWKGYMLYDSEAELPLKSSLPDNFMINFYNQNCIPFLVPLTSTLC